MTVTITRRALLAGTGAALIAGQARLAGAQEAKIQLWQLPIAASVALAVGGFGGWLGKSETGGTGGLAVAAIEEAALIEALADAKSGESREIGSGVGFTAIASFRDGDGQLCREFEQDRAGADTVVAVACRAGQGWSVRFAVAAAASDDTGYAPASSLETLDAWLSAIEAGAPMSEDEEAAALADLR